MGEFLLAWITKNPVDKVVSVLILAGFLALVAFIIVKLVLKLRKSNINPTATITSEGLKFGIETNKDSKDNKNISPPQDMGQAFINFIHIRNDKQEKEIENLRLELNELKEELHSVQLRLNLKRQIDDDFKKTLLPFNQHGVFLNLNIIMERGLTFPIIHNDNYTRKTYIAKMFMEKCRYPAFYKNLLEWVDNIEAEETESTKMEVLFTLPTLFYSTLDETMHRAKELELIIDNTCIVGIPDCFINRYKDWNRIHLATTIDKLKIILYSSFYKTWQLKLILCLDTLDMIFSLVQSELVSTIDSLNGEVDKEIEQKIIEAKCK